MVLSLQHQSVREIGSLHLCHLSVSLFPAIVQCSLFCASLRDFCRQAQLYLPASCELLEETMSYPVNAWRLRNLGK